MRPTSTDRRGAPSWADRRATDPHGFPPVAADPEPSIPRQRADAPEYDPWDPEARRGGGSGDRYSDLYSADAYTAADAYTEEEAEERYAAEAAQLYTADPRVAERPRRRSAPPRRPATETTRVEEPRRARRARAPEQVPQQETFLDPGPRLRTIAVPAAIGGLVAVGLGVWAKAHDPTGVAVNLAGFSSGPAVKTWLATLALVLALGQGWTGMVLRGRIGSGPTPLTATVHRWSGRLAVLVTVPVAVQCLFALGWSGASARTLIHSLLGCVFYGAFVTKMLLLNRRGVPGWVVAVCGGLLLAVLTGIWLTSALWFFGTHGLSF